MLYDKNIIDSNIKYKSLLLFTLFQLHLSLIAVNNFINLPQLSRKFANSAYAAQNPRIKA